jgi:hypothetical protein
MIVVNSCAECIPLRPDLLRPYNVNVVVVHRISFSQYDKDPIPDDELTGPELVKRFEDKGLGTGGRPPYSAMVRTDAVVEQMLPLLVQGEHLGGHNWCSWSVAVVGRYHEQNVSASVWNALVNAVAVLSTVPRKVMGHTELSPHKKPNCPGRFLDMNHVRAAVKERWPDEAESWDIRQRLRYITEAGFTL